MGHFVKPLIASVTFAIIFVGFANSAFAASRKTVLHGNGCIEVNGSFYRNGQPVQSCPRATVMTAPQAPSRSGQHPDCNGKPGHSFIIDRGHGRKTLVVCR